MIAHGLEPDDDCARCCKPAELTYYHRHKKFFCATCLPIVTAAQAALDMRLCNTSPLEIQIDRLLAVWARSHLSSVRPSQRITQRGKQHEMARA